MSSNITKNLLLILSIIKGTAKFLELCLQEGFVDERLGQVYRN